LLGFFLLTSAAELNKKTPKTYSKSILKQQLFFFVCFDSLHALCDKNK
jgi:hypothetical protein